jgi:hypothetical protein
MKEKEKRIAESLLLCEAAPMKCRECVEEFGIGCGTRLRRRAAEIIEEMARELERTEKRQFCEK